MNPGSFGWGGGSLLGQVRRAARLESRGEVELGLGRIADMVSCPIRLVGQVTTTTTSF